ncbi:MAG TPA: NADH:ubiquinone reductase (Na(+)-transporting) subunit D [Flavobacteriales bacterium]|nr:NADH:ubiquinone reductase (Na(+)-transporting) subunit D [Flavobacteriales bacterium]HCA82634.1 NADH:ubiquinone reductase (Na(+)-transporting) subunit D [Flavobacteriales bacterium]HRE74428.1 NADH:ubiquinone reductase (Na(+)-transporting) subunit D [Flavobacteriales bacterium]HRE97401.1 NADH:ubiquinone reductase (Na(+)-transporting) subunit D [Flavobacteriales bacterium]HRJ34908.1 NADH:ubiquinone reductase (Na(+)-transporting) subunit D [Flavobacteriales bacterium]
MSEATAPAKSPSEGLFSKKNRKLITDPLNDSNPITVQVLGICSALAVTVKLDNSVVMAASVTAVTIMGNFFMSLMRNIVPNRIRIIVQLVVVAWLVIIVDQVLKAYVYDVSKSLSVFVGLIITNCIIMGRIEAFALGNKPGPSILDGLGNGIGYGIILIFLGIVRELFGSGKLWNAQVLPANWIYSMDNPDGWYVLNNFMIMPPMALILVGLYIWAQRARNTKLIEAH